MLKIKNNLRVKKTKFIPIIFYSLENLFRSFIEKSGFKKYHTLFGFVIITNY